MNETLKKYLKCLLFFCIATAAWIMYQIYLAPFFEKNSAEAFIAILCFWMVLLIPASLLIGRFPLKEAVRGVVIVVGTLLIFYFFYRRFFPFIELPLFKTVAMFCIALIALIDESWRRKLSYDQTLLIFIAICLIAYVYYGLIIKGHVPSPSNVTGQYPITAYRLIK